MSFDYAAAEKRSSAQNKPLIGAIVLGQSRAGKSYLAGTMPGKVLFLHTQGEDHGKDSAKMLGGKRVVPVCIDIDEKTGKQRGYDSAYKFVLELLSDIDAIVKQGFESIVIDGLTELEQLVRATQPWAMDCRTKGNEHNSFAEPAATIKAIRPILDALRTLQREKSLHYYMTCLLMVKGMEDNGEITASEPKLIGYEVAAMLIPQFPDQVVIGRMTNDKGEESHRLQFSAKSYKLVKEKSGEIKKFIGFTPCLRGVPSSKLPSNMKADFGAVLKLKKECMSGAA